jgi:geranylgeranyl diphosphate synthase type II
MKFDRYRDIIDTHILDYIPTIDEKAKTLYDSMKYSLTSGGKRVRPVMLLAATDFCGGDINEALPYAIAVEYIHNYSLIHDDLPAMDDDNFRRGKETNHIVFGESMAILTGDALLSTAFEIMNKDLIAHINRKNSLGKFINAINQISKASGVLGMITGQVADIESSGKKVSKEMTFFINLNKTAALIKAATLAGIFIGDGSKELFHAFEIYGEEIGLTFQIIDDILDYGKHNNETNSAELFGVEFSKKHALERTNKAIDAIKDFSEQERFFTDFAEDMLNRIN